MATLTLTVCGTTYGGGPAGAGSNNFEADDHGVDADRVFYKYTKKGIVFNSVAIGEAYLDPSERAAIDSMGVTFQPRSEVDTATAASYYLWLYDPKSKKIG